MKTCNSCNIAKNQNEFGARAINSDGLDGYCRGCRNEKSKKWREKNKEKVSGYNKKYAQNYLGSMDKLYVVVVKLIEEGLTIHAALKSLKINSGMFYNSMTSEQKRDLKSIKISFRRSRS